MDTSHLIRWVPNSSREVTERANYFQNKAHQQDGEISCCRLQHVHDLICKAMRLTAIAAQRRRRGPIEDVITTLHQNEAIPPSQKRTKVIDEILKNHDYQYFRSCIFDNFRCDDFDWKTGKRR
ncbi:hypothetical protein BT69DRAFT_325478 [Atractiella rhizophila]|nr:hypothetical protein BT69DRAFT_325478 [Atractiella rhizophila]